MRITNCDTSDAELTKELLFIKTCYQHDINKDRKMWV